MFVIFPAEELILMTYGAAIPRISPRPTLDCLREPQVPIVVPARSLPPLSPQLPKPLPQSPQLPQSVPTVREFTTALPTIPPTAPANSISLISKGGIVEPGPDAELPFQTTGIPLPSRYPHSGRTLLPTISERSSPSVHAPSLTPPPSATPPRRSSHTSLKRSTPVHRTPISLRKVEETPLSAIPPASTLNVPMYNDRNMRSSQQQQPQEHLPGTSVLASQNSPMEFEYPTGSLQRDRSPSIFLEPSTPDPTQPRLGPGWGRPMSPMDLPPEPSTSQKSPSSKTSRLRPKLHIPLGRLGRSTSSDQRESYRLREDLELQVENPVFNTENLRQRNFDAFFDSGEPVYKLQPKTSHTPSNESSTTGKVSPALDNYAGVYDSSPRRGRGNTSGGLFARSHKDETRPKTSEHNDPARDVRSASMEPGSISAASGGSASGVPQKGDRCPQFTF